MPPMSREQRVAESLRARAAVQASAEARRARASTPSSSSQQRRTTGTVTRAANRASLAGARATSEASQSKLAKLFAKQDDFGRDLAHLLANRETSASAVTTEQSRTTGNRTEEGQAALRKEVAVLREEILFLRYLLVVFSFVAIIALFLSAIAIKRILSG